MIDNTCFPHDNNPWLTGEPRHRLPVEYGILPPMVSFWKGLWRNIENNAIACRGSPGKKKNSKSNGDCR